MTKFKSTLMADFATELPQDLINEVLLRLPARSIGRFRCVSKPWRSFLSSPKFAKSHLNFHLHRTAPNLILPAVCEENDGLLAHGWEDVWSGLRHLLTFPADGGDGHSRKVTCPFFGNWGWMEIDAACHGFVLAEIQNAGRHVFNPVTLESFKLDNIEDIYGSGYLEDIYDMGYDSCNDVYKVIKLSHFEAHDDSDPEFATYVDVYSFKTKHWERVVMSPYDHDIPDGDNMIKYHGVCMNDCLHWVALDMEDESLVIAVFNLAREEFVEELSLPKNFGGGTEILHVAVLRGCLAIVCNPSNDCTVVWLMKEYGVQESWEKLVINTHGRYLRVINVLFLSREDEFYLVGLSSCFEHKLVAFSLITGIWRDIVVDDVPAEFDHEALTFTDCLLSPNYISA